MATDDGMGSWQCSTCTLINAGDAAKCDVCDTARPGSAAPAQQMREAQAPPHQQQAAQVPTSAPAAAASAPTLSTASTSGAGLNKEARELAQQELAVKRQKMNEEKQRILLAAERDRADRLESRGAAPTSAPTAAAAAPAAAVAASKPLPQSVRLQLRCPQWNRNIVFTCFGPENTLADVRKWLREDLVNGVAGTGDGQLRADSGAQQARVPEEGAIALVETVPPRRRFVTAEDMQISLVGAGLCPSGSLMVEAKPIELEQPPIQDLAPAVHAEREAEESPGSEERGAHREQDGEDDDYSEDASDDDGGQSGFGGKGFGKGGMGPTTGSGTFGSGGGRQKMGGASANWRFGVHGGPRGGPMIGEGGQVLGSSSGGTAASGGAALAAGGASAEDQRAAREARLAALERRGVASTEAAPTSSPAIDAAAAAPTPNPAALAPAAATVAAAAPGSKKAKDAEKQELMARIAEERAERDERLGRSAAPQIVAATPATQLAKATAPPLQAVVPLADPTRIKGQMGGSKSKIERAKEREAILQKMEEDKQDKAVRAPVRPAAAEESSTSSVPISVNTLTGETVSLDAAASRPPRLKVTCSSSGRSVITSAFAATASLSAVRDFAIAELGFSTAEASVAEMSLAYPPRTAFAAPEQLSASLSDLGLCPSATLIIKGGSSHLSGAAAAEDEQEAESATNIVGEANQRMCPGGHVMTTLSPTEEAWCDKCSKGLPVGCLCFECQTCEYVVCEDCAI